MLDSDVLGPFLHKPEEDPEYDTACCTAVVSLCFYTSFPALKGYILMFVFFFSHYVAVFGTVC